MKEPATESHLALQRLVILVLTAALAVVLGAALWHLVAWLFSDKPTIGCFSPNANCGPG